MNNYEHILNKVLLIPSFSSKGNIFINKNGYDISDNYDLIKLLSPNLYHTYLISAYDVYYGFMPSNDIDYPIAEYIMIDSGGYEISQSFDLSEQYKFNYKVNIWDEYKMYEVYNKIYTSEAFKYCNLILCTFDCNESIERQISNAKKLIQLFPNAIVDFLIKIPDNFENTLNQIKLEQIEMSNFNLIGFTEKELGNTLKEKLLNIIMIRDYADEQNWNVSIHIFGGLEPNICTLYNWAGAQIFDGLSWQKLRYNMNSTVYSPSFFIIDKNEYDNKYLMMSANLNDLEKLENQLINYNLTKDIKENRAKFKRLLMADNLTIDSIIGQMGGLL